MSDNYIELYYHIVWPTKNREPYITPDVEPRLINYLATLSRSMGISMLAMNGMPDHLHVVCCIPPTLSVSQVVKDLKAKSAHFINRLEDDRYSLTWQPGYGALTFAKRNVDFVVRYVQNQKQHHMTGDLSSNLEKWASNEALLRQAQSNNTDLKCPGGTISRS